MGARTVDGKGRSNPNPHHHEAQLIVQRVGQDLAEIIFDDGKEDGKCGHHTTNRNQKLESGIASRKRIDGQFSGERTQEDRTRESGFWIGTSWSQLWRKGRRL